MPNSRRRKFSVRNGFAGRKPSKVDRGFQTSAPGLDPEVNNPANNIVTINVSKSKIRMHPDSSRNSNNVDVTSECESTSTMITVQKQSNITIDKDITATASNIDLFHIMHATEYLAEPLKAYRESFNTIDKNETPSKRITRQVTQDKASMKRDKYPRQHRIKVRSPKRRIGIGIIETQNKIYYINKLTANTGTEAIDWEHETQLSAVNVLNVPDTIEDDERQSDHSSDDMCRICHGGDGLSPELGLLISACSCRGTVGRVHVKCLERWLTESGKSRCELCGTRYATRRVHRYGVPRALVMWILSQNAKQLMVDSLGIMLMSPLAVLAAWLSGRTLAGLMTQDAHSTPWPLASTFVLACMTLVCYYCWIVSAATRHALGWWIWYRSQYEVRLELDIEE